MKPRKRKSKLLLPPVDEGGSCSKAGTPEEEKKESNEHRDEPVQRRSQTFLSETISLDEEEEDLEDQLTDYNIAFDKLLHSTGIHNIKETGAKDPEGSRVQGLLSQHHNYRSSSSLASLLSDRENQLYSLPTPFLLASDHHGEPEQQQQQHRQVGGDAINFGLTPASLPPSSSSSCSLLYGAHCQVNAIPVQWDYRMGRVTTRRLSPPSLGQSMPTQTPDMYSPHFSSNPVVGGGQKRTKLASDLVFSKRRRWLPSLVQQPPNTNTNTYTPSYISDSYQFASNPPVSPVHKDLDILSNYLYSPVLASASSSDNRLKVKDAGFMPHSSAGSMPDYFQGSSSPSNPHTHHGRHYSTSHSGMASQYDKGTTGTKAPGMYQQTSLYPHYPFSMMLAGGPTIQTADASNIIVHQGHSLPSSTIQQIPSLQEVLPLDHSLSPDSGHSTEKNITGPITHTSSRRKKISKEHYGLEEQSHRPEYNPYQEDSDSSSSFFSYIRPTKDKLQIVSVNERGEEKLHSIPLTFSPPSTSSPSYQDQSDIWPELPVSSASLSTPPPNITSPSNVLLQRSSPLLGGYVQQRWATAGHPSTTDTLPVHSHLHLQDSPISTEESPAVYACKELGSLTMSMQNHDSPEKMVPEATAGHPSTPDILPVHSHSHLSYSSLPHSHNMPSPSQLPVTKNKKYTQAMRRHSLPDILLQDSFKTFTPDIAENRETYMFQCTYPGLYQCRVTGLVFNMEGEGDVVYRIVPWNRRLLAQHSKKPAGPLFDIKCHQQSVCQLHLPHCEIRSTGGCEFLSVAHVTDKGTEFILPHRITETHVIINITGFSALGNVKDENSPPDPIRALVLLFYNPPVDPDLRSVLNVLLLPGNIVLSDVLHKRKKIIGDERYIEISSRCKLHPEQEYNLSTSPEDNTILIQPKEAEFDSESYDNYIPTFQVTFKKVIEDIRLLLKESNDSQCVWERQVCLWSAAVRKSQVQSGLSLPSNERLLRIWSSFIDRVSGPVLKSLLDKLFEKRVINDAERESVDEKQNQRDKARHVIDMVCKKGEDASSEMIAFLCEVDPFFSRHLQLT